MRTDGRIFRDAKGEAWRWKGVSAFQLLDRFARGEEIDPFLETFASLGYNLLRVWPYVTWPGTGWASASQQRTIDFLAHVAEADFFCELTLLTDDDAGRIQPGAALVRVLASKAPTNLVLEIGNEPTQHKSIDTNALRRECEQSRFLFSSGEYEDSSKWFGSFLTAHTPRDSEWVRKAHDLLEYFNGGGPGSPSDPAVKVPCVADEPIRPDQAAYVARDFCAYAATSSLLGAGATFHYEGGKYARLPNEMERRCAEAFADGLRVFPADAPNGAYRRIDEGLGSLRTYVVGRYMTRVRPSSPKAPESGWSPLDTYGVAFMK